MKVVAVVVAVVLGKVTSKDLKLKGFNKVRQQGEPTERRSYSRRVKRIFSAIMSRPESILIRRD